MQSPPVASDERVRLDALHRLGILDTPPSDRFDRITRLLARVLDAPVSLVSLVDADRQWFKSCVGLPMRETPRGISFCGHAILRRGIFEIPDAWADERFRDNPLVLGKPHIRFYAGVPVHAPSGPPIGTLCVLDHEPRRLDDPDRQTLRDLGAWVETELLAYARTHEELAESA